MSEDGEQQQQTFEGESPKQDRRPNISDYLKEQEKKRGATSVTPGTEAKRHKKPEFTLSDSDSEDDEEAEKEVIEFPFTVIPVQNNSLPGFAFYATGFADKYMAEIQYQRNDRENKKKAKNYLKFIRHVECVEHVNTVLEQGSKTLVRKKDADGKYPYKAWVKTYAPGTEITQDLVKTFLNDEFVPAFMTVVGDNLRENQKPGFNENSMELAVSNWSDAVIPADLGFIFTDFEKRFVNKKIRIGSWIRESSDNLYAIYTRGQLPKNVHKAYNLPDEILDPLDLAYFNKKNAAK